MFERRLILCILVRPHRQNTMMEMWNTFNWAVPGCLGDRLTFRKDFQVPIRRRSSLCMYKYTNHPTLPALAYVIADASFFTS